MSALIKPDETRKLAVQALPHQMDFWRDFTNERRFGVVGALGQGKTRALIIKDLVLHLYNHRAAMAAGERSGLRSMLIEPTFGMVQDILIPEYEAVVQGELGIPIKMRVGARPRIDWPRSFGYAQTLLRSGENPARLVGTNLSHVGVDEPGMVQQESFRKAFARVRDPRAAVKQRFVCGTPEGVSGYFFDKFSNPKPPYYRIKGHHWHPSMKHYPHQIREEFASDEAYLQSYLNGEFVPLLSGRAFRAFNENIHVRACEPKPNWPLILSCDFNVDHMSWTVSQSTQTEVWTFDEIRLSANRQTQDAAHEFVRRYAERYGNYPLTITGDASGDARSTSGEIDYDVAMQIIRAGKFRRVRLDIPRGNPRVKDRVDNANFHLSGHENSVECTISPKCETLIRDLLSVTWANNGRDFDKRNAELTHTADAWSYMLWRLFPQWTVRKRRVPTRRHDRGVGSDNMATSGF